MYYNKRKLILFIVLGFGVFSMGFNAEYLAAIFLNLRSICGLLCVSLLFVSGLILYYRDKWKRNICYHDKEVSELNNQIWNLKSQIQLKNDIINKKRNKK